MGAYGHYINNMTVAAVPGTFSPIRILSIFHTDLIHFSKKVMRNMFLVFILSSQKELYSLRRSIWEEKELPKLKRSHEESKVC